MENLSVKEKAAFIIVIMERQIQEASAPEDLLRMFDNLSAFIGEDIAVILQIYTVCFVNLGRGFDYKQNDGQEEEGGEDENNSYPDEFLKL